jgi:hypothetical protein
MIGIRVAPEASGIIFSFPPATKVAFINFDFSTEHSFAFGFQFIGDNFAQPEERKGRCLAVHTTKAGRSLIFRATVQQAAPYPPFLIKDDPNADSFAHRFESTAPADH